jgi:DNA ligase (NAD+)
MACSTGGWACPAQLRRRIEDYADVLDVGGLGGEFVDQLVDAGLLERPADLYTLDRGELAGLEGWGEKSAANVLAEIDAAREVPLGDFLAAISIPEVGPAVARNVAREFGTLEAVLAADEVALERAPDVGPEVARRVVSFFESDANRAEVDALLAHVDVEAAETDVGDELDGLTFVFTGSLPVARSDAQDLVEAHGASATSSVSGNTDYLVAGEDPGRSKRSDADSEGVPVLDEDAFADLLAERGVAWPPENEG